MIWSTMRRGAAWAWQSGAVELIWFAALAGWNAWLAQYGWVAVFCFFVGFNLNRVMHAVEAALEEARWKASTISSREGVYVLRRLADDLEDGRPIKTTVRIGP